MTTTGDQELHELALLAELARPLVHECNNFLNNLLLQLAISENELPEAHRADWNRVRQRGKMLGKLLQDWQRRHKSFAEGPARTAVQAVVREIAELSGMHDPAMKIATRLPAEPLWFAVSESDVKRLLWLLLRYANSELEPARKEPPNLEIQAVLVDKTIILQIEELGPTPAPQSWHDFDQENSGDPRLLVAACCSMAQRLGGSICSARLSTDRSALRLTLPAASS